VLLAGAAVAACAVPAVASAGPLVASPLLTQFAGTGSPGPEIAGAALSSPLGGIDGIALGPDGSVYLADPNTDHIDKVTPGGQLTIIAGNGSPGPEQPGSALSSPMGTPTQMVVNAAGDLLFVDQSYSHVYEVTPGGVLSVVAGNGTHAAPTPGPASASGFLTSIGLAQDSAGDLFVADAGKGAHEVVEITPSGTLSVVAGNGTNGAPVPGPATSSPLGAIQGIAVDPSGNLYIADVNNHVVEKVTPGGTLSVFAGTGTNGSPSPGPAAASMLKGPVEVATDATGNVYISDSSDGRVDKVTPDGTLSIAAGTGTNGTATYGVAATSSELHFPQGVAVTPGGTIYVDNFFNWTVDQIVPLTPSAQAPPTITGPAVSGQTLTEAPAAWSNDPTSITYQWQDCDASGANCVNIAGATAATYTLTAADVGSTVRVVETASNDGGSAGQTAAQTAVVQTATPTSTPTPVPAPTSPTPTPVAVSLGAVPSAGIVVSDRGQAMLTLVCPATPTGCDASGVLVIHLPKTLLKGAASLSDANAADATGTTVLASFSGRRIAGGHSAVIAVRLNALVLRRLQTLRIRRVKVTLTVSNHLNGGPTVRTTDTIYLQIPPLGAGACPVATGQLTARTLGPVTLGGTRARARQLMPGYTARSYHTDNFCLYDASGIRVGYGSTKLLGAAASAALPAMTGRVILALTANPYYTIDGIRPGSTLATAARHLHLSPVVHAGHNDWYVIPGTTRNDVLKVRDGVVKEIGIATKRLTGTHAQQLQLLSNF
jgi:NHL repeat-containing protein